MVRHPPRSGGNVDDVLVHHRGGIAVLGSIIAQVGLIGFGLIGSGWGSHFAQSTMMAEASELNIIDSRSAEDDRPRYLSVMITSCNYFIRVLNDEGRARERLAALGDHLKSALGNRIRGHTLEVRRYQLFFNEAAAMTNYSFAVAEAVTGAPTVREKRAVPKCGREKTRGGWFDPSETSNGNSPLVVEFEGAFDGHPIAIRSVYSPTVKLSTLGTFMTSKAKKNLYDKKAAPEVDRAIDKVNAKIASEIVTYL